MFLYIRHFVHIQPFVQKLLRQLVSTKIADDFSFYHVITDRSQIDSRKKISVFKVRIMVFNITYNNMSVISWRSVSFVEEIGVPGDNHRPSAAENQYPSPLHVHASVFINQNISIKVQLPSKRHISRRFIAYFLFGYIISNSGRCACHPFIGIIICYIGC